MSTLDNPQMEPANASPQQTIIRFGMIGGLVLIIYSLVNFVFGLSKPSAGAALGYLNFAIVVAIYVLIMVYAVRDHRDANQNGFITFGKAFTVAFLTSLVAAVINSVFAYLYIHMIDPGYINEILESSEEFYEKSGFSEQQIEVSLDWAKWMMEGKGQLIIFAVGTFFGAILSLIVGYSMKKDPPVFG
ncbi:MAG: hypothetical protein DHS20C18_08750 [Saprospiraceae bacterium]|nr:MAG: hypothetical protein DHS20C18_08750 [Saprospiraceae bacterium]